MPLSKNCTDFCNVFECCDRHEVPVTLTHIQTQCAIHLETLYIPVPHHCSMDQGASFPTDYPTCIPDRSRERNLVESKGPLNPGELGFDQILWMRKVMGQQAERSTMSL